MGSDSPRVIPVDALRPARAAVEAAAAALRSGELVVLPTETVYGVAGHPDVAGIEEKLFSAKDRDRSKPIPLLAFDVAAVRRRGAELGPRALRLARRYWPGPLTLVLRCGTATEGFRVPDHAVARAVLKAAGGLLRVTSANMSGAPAACDALDAASALGRCVSLVLDAGPAALGTPSTVVRVVDDEVSILRHGAIGAQAVLAPHLALLVCTGNVCRSPMGEVLLRQWLGPGSEWDVASAGVSAAEGLPASLEALTVVAEKGLDLSAHRSQPLDEGLVDAADVIVVMTDAHRRIIRRCFPKAGTKIVLLNEFSSSRRGEDVPDPIGMMSDVYRCVRDEIDAAMPDLVLYLRDKAKR